MMYYLEELLTHLDTILFWVALLDITTATAWAVVLYRIHSIGRPTSPRAIPILALLLIIAGFTLPVPRLAVLLSHHLLSPATATVQLLVTSLVFSLGLTTTLLGRSYELNARFDKAWVKALDFPYLGLALFGLFRLIESAYAGHTNVTLGIISTSALGAALSIRLTKATIETFFDSWIGRK
jgi:hypothetical protein